MASGASPSHGEGDEAGPRVGYLVPEFPGQTHIFIWREIVWMRRFGANLHLFSTRLPPERDAARHAFAEEARASTLYLVPMGVFGALAALGWGLLHPWGLLRCIGLGLTLPVDKKPRWKSLLPLILPACRLAREARRRSLEHLHSHSCANAAILCMMVRRLAGIPFSMTLHADLGWWGGAMREKMADARFTLVITRRLMQDIALMRAGLEEKLFLGRMGVDTETWSPPPGPRPAPRGRIVTVGRLHPSKGHDDLLKAAAILMRSGISLDLRVIGEGPQRKELEDLARALGLNGVVRFLGSLSEREIIDIMKDADVFVLASHAEALGVVYMEAMSMGVPAIGTAAGGVGEIIKDGENGLLVAPKNPEMLAQAIRSILTDRDLAARLSVAGRKTIVEEFDSRIGAGTLFKRIAARAPGV